MKLVNKEDVVEAIENTDWYHINTDGELVSGANSQDYIPLYKADDVYKAIESVKSADAIPIEWIEQYVESKTALVGVSELWIKWMIEDWQKEQEKQND